MPKLVNEKTDKRKSRVTVRERFSEDKVNEDLLPLCSMEDAIPLFMNAKKANNLKERTLKGYAQHLRYFSEWLQEEHGSLSVNKIDIHILRQYVLWCSNDKVYFDGHPFRSSDGEGRTGISPASVNVRIRVLKTFFATLHHEGVIARNPAEKLSLMRVEQDTVQPLTDDEVKRLLAVPDTKYFAQFRDYVIMILMLDTGMRLNEVCSLEIKDVDIRSRQIVLPASKNKNRKSRTIPLSSETLKLLTQIIHETREHFDTAYVFNTYYGEPINEKTIQKAFTKYAREAGIEKRFSPHVLRHNFAKMAALNGMDIFTLMRILGHADISTTRKYVQVNDEDVKQQHMQFSPLQRIMKRK